MNQRLKQEITRSYPVLRRSEKKTADYLLKCGENLKDLTLEKIAESNRTYSRHIFFYS